MENYSRELLHQKDRIEYMSYFANTFEERVPQSLAKLEKLSHTPLKKIAKLFLQRSHKRDHFGQIVPLEDMEKILAQMDGIVRLSCPCRRVTVGQRDARYYFALTADPRLAASIDSSFSLEVITSSEAIDSIKALEKEGLFHSVWTFKTPYIGAVCNCDQDCIAYRISYSRSYYQTMFRGEYVGRVDVDACNGCRNCMRQCHFGATVIPQPTKK